MKYPLYSGQEVLFTGIVGPLYAIIMCNYKFREDVGDLVVIMEDDPDIPYVVDSKYCIPWELRDEPY